MQQRARVEMVVATAEQRRSNCLPINTIITKVYKDLACGRSCMMHGHSSLQYTYSPSFYFFSLFFPFRAHFFSLFFPPFFLSLVPLIVPFID
jgi:hypothetical protein